MARYVIQGPWVAVSVLGARPGETLYTITTEVATLRDTRTGDSYPSGARRVRVSPRFTGARTRTFKGETAWSRADNYARDIQFTISRATTEQEG